MQAEHIHPKLRFLSRIAHHFEAMVLDGRRFDSKLILIMLKILAGIACVSSLNLVNLADERMQ